MVSVTEASFMTQCNPAKIFYTKVEDIFNAVTHGIGAVFSIGGTGALLALASCPKSVFIYLVYGLSLILLYTMSTLYHAFPNAKLKSLFRIFDHASIFLLIAGTYTPLTLILLSGSRKAAIVCGVVWATALLGVALNAFGVERFAKLSLILYVAMGWAVVFVLNDVIRALSRSGFWLLLDGGLFYTVGIIFYVWHKKKHTPYMHGVWHLFVLAGSVLHYLCILLYVVPFQC